MFQEYKTTPTEEKSPAESSWTTVSSSSKCSPASKASTQNTDVSDDAKTTDPPPLPTRYTVPNLSLTQSFDGTATLGRTSFVVFKNAAPVRPNVVVGGHSTVARIPIRRKRSTSRDKLRLRGSAESSSSHSDYVGLSVPEWVEGVSRKRLADLEDEFIRIPQFDERNSTFHAFCSNAGKNRYADVLCTDASRVQLQGRNNDYIHASYCDGYRRPRAYISTQGPLKETVVDFWKMVWEENVLLIVMTTKLAEQGREKCAEYWPRQPGKSKRYGPFVVLNEKCFKHDDHDLTNLTVRHVSASTRRSMYHLFYHAWPDYKTPRSISKYLSFVEMVHSIHSSLSRSSRTSPILIHCSAGVGRTGTFIAIDISMQRMQHCRKVAVAETVKAIRAQRAHSVQTVDQYIFIHMVLMKFALDKGLVNRESITCRGSLFDAVV